MDISVLVRYRCGVLCCPNIGHKKPPAQKHDSGPWCGVCNAELSNADCHADCCGGWSHANVKCSGIPNGHLHVLNKSEMH